MNLIEYNESYYSIWQEFSCKYGNLYHDIRWKNIIEESYKLKSNYLLIFSENNLIAIFPSFYTKKDNVISLPYTSYCGVAISNAIMFDEVQRAIKNYFKEKGVFKIITRQYDGADKTLTEADYVTMIKALEQNEETAFASLHYKQKNKIRSSYKNPFSLICATVNEYYPIYLKATNALGTPGHKKIFFENIVKYFKDSARINVLKYKEKSIGVIFEIDFNNTRYDLWAFSLKEYLYLKPNIFIYWETLKDSISKGMEYYDFGRSIYEGSTYNFKKRWNSNPVKLKYSLTDLHSGIPMISNIKPASGGVISKMWTMMPNILSNKIGPIIRKYIY